MKFYSVKISFQNGNGKFDLHVDFEYFSLKTIRAYLTLRFINFYDVVSVSFQCGCDHFS